MKTQIRALVASAPRWLVAIVLSASAAVQAGTFNADFNAGVPAGSTVHGSASATGGVLELTPATTYQTGSLVLDDLDAWSFVKSFSASFKIRIGGGGSGGDGLSFNFGPEIPDGAFGMEGASFGLTVSFDTYDNGGGEAPAVGGPSADSATHIVAS